MTVNTLPPPPSAPPTSTNTIAPTTPPSAGVAPRGYWRKLLGWGVVLNVLGGMLLQGYFDAVSSSDDGSGGGSFGFGAVVCFAIANVIMIPGLIGWGIDASGLTRD